MKPSPAFRPAAIVTFVCLLVLLTACSEGPGNNVLDSKDPGNSGTSGKNNTHRWYIIEDGVLREHPGFAQAGAGGEPAEETRADELQTEEFLPWTVQERIAGFAEAGGDLYCAVNGAGVAVFEDVTGGGAFSADLRTVNNSFLFAGRTIGNIFTFNGTVYCHLYRNTLFDTAPPEADPVSLVGLVPGEGRFRVTVLSFQDNHPDWEVVELIPDAEGPWHLGWKYSGEMKTDFRYSRLDPRTRQEREIDRETFRGCYRFNRTGRLPPPVAELADRYFSGADGPRFEGGPAVVHISVKSPGCTGVERYRLGDLEDLGSETDRIFRIPGFRRGDFWFFLLPGGEIFRAAAEDAGINTIKTIELPRLPDGFVYTHLWAGENSAAVSWEEQRFTEVGRAGMLVLPLFPLQ